MTTKGFVSNVPQGGVETRTERTSGPHRKRGRGEEVDDGELFGPRNLQVDWDTVKLPSIQREGNG